MVEIIDPLSDEDRISLYIIMINNELDRMSSDIQHLQREIAKKEALVTEFHKTLKGHE